MNSLPTKEELKQIAMNMDIRLLRENKDHKHQLINRVYKNKTYTPADRDEIFDRAGIPR